MAMKDSPLLPAFPSYGDGFCDFNRAHQGNGRISLYMPNSEDCANATVIKKSHALLAVCVRPKDEGASRREVSKKGKTKKRKREQSVVGVDSDKAGTNVQRRRRSARLSNRGSMTRVWNEEGGGDDDDDDEDFMG